MKYENLLNFYKNNEDKLLFLDGLRPPKSFTRNVMTSVPKFVEWYKKYGETTLTYNQISNEICHLSNSGETTIGDNIRNMIELQFITKLENPNNYQFTRNFIEYVYSNKELIDYIIDEMKKIDSINSITTLYNYILATLREGIIKGYITLYPDSEEKFKEAVSNKAERISILKSVYDLYGFKGRASEPNEDNYTPNINYRIISTCSNLGLITRMGNDEFGFSKYILTDKANEVLVRIDNNIKNYSDNVVSINKKFENTLIKTEDIYETKNIDNIYEDIYDELYIAQSNNVKPNLISGMLNLDAPQPIVNNYAITSTRRDPIKAANSKVAANYECEYNHNHISFTTKTTNKNYVEAHHLVPMQLQEKFFYSLDIESNIIALCPVCHRQIHHATNEERREIIIKLYNNRIERLKKCNVFIELEDLLNFYCGNQNF